MFRKKQKDTKKHNYDLTYDNVAIPEIHTHKSKKEETSECEQPAVHYDNVAIPEIHIRKKKP